MWTLIAFVIEASQVALQIFSLPPLQLSSMPQPQHTFLQFLTSSTMIASAKDLPALQPALPRHHRLLPPPPNLIFSNTIAFAKEVLALHILRAHLSTPLQSQAGALLLTSRARPAAAAIARAQPLAALQN